MKRGALKHPPRLNQSRPCTQSDVAEGDMRFGIPHRLTVVRRKCRSTFKFTLVAGSILSFGLAFSRPALGQAPPPQAALTPDLNHRTATPEAKLTLRVYNYARLDSASLVSSERVADGILENLGIATAWVDCPLSEKTPRAYLACQSQMGTTDLVLRILPRRMAMKLPRHQESLGFAQTCPETEPACELNVFYHQIDELATKGYRADRILGYVIAHEVAHVLIGPGHSDEGIMRGAWTPADLQRLSWGLSLDFTNDQSRRMRLAVLRRTTLPVQEASTQASLIAPSSEK
jgi:hypothetical protein